MQRREKSGQIAWMLRLLVAVGLTTIISLLVLAGFQINLVHRERVKLQKVQEQISQTSEEILRRSGEARTQFIALLDERATVQSPGAAARLNKLADSLAASTAVGLSPASLSELKSLTEKLVQAEGRAVVWRARCEPLWQDTRQQRTLGKVRDLITHLRGAAGMLEGRRNLQEAVLLRRWRAAGPAEAAQLANSILTQQVARKNQTTGDLERELAEVESLVELLGGEERADNLPNLKDNQLAPALKRLRRDVERFIEQQPENGIVSGETMDRLAAALFGAEFESPSARGSARPSEGFYALRRDILALRSERIVLEAEGSSLASSIDAGVVAVRLVAGAQSERLAEEADQRSELLCREAGKQLLLNKPDYRRAGGSAMRIASFGAGEPGGKKARRGEQRVFANPLLAAATTSIGGAMAMTAGVGTRFGFGKWSPRHGESNSRGRKCERGSGRRGSSA